MRAWTLVAVAALLVACGDDTTADGGGAASTSSADAAGNGGAGSTAEATGGTTTSGEGGASTSGEGGATTSGEGGSPGPIQAACDTFDERILDIANELGCAPGVATCPTYLSHCESEVVALYACWTGNATAADCACEPNGDTVVVRCPGLADACREENDALLECDDV